jgi:hypothetical protein
MIRDWFVAQLDRLMPGPGAPGNSVRHEMDDAAIPHAMAPYAGRIDPAWSPEWIRRTLTDEPGKGMGAPFSEANAQLFLRAMTRNTRRGA